MKPSPVGVDDDGRSGSCATTCSALADSERRVNLSSVGANLLGASDCQKASGGEDRREHDEGMFDCFVG